MSSPEHAVSAVWLLLRATFQANVQGNGVSSFAFANCRHGASSLVLKLEDCMLVKELSNFKCGSSLSQCRLASHKI